MGDEDGAHTQGRELGHEPLDEFTVFASVFLAHGVGEGHHLVEYDVEEREGDFGVVASELEDVDVPVLLHDVLAAWGFGVDEVAEHVDHRVHGVLLAAHVRQVVVGVLADLVLRVADVEVQVVGAHVGAHLVEDELHDPGLAASWFAGDDDGGGFEEVHCLDATVAGCSDNDGHLSLGVAHELLYVGGCGVHVSKGDHADLGSLVDADERARPRLGAGGVGIGVFEVAVVVVLVGVRDFISNRLSLHAWGAVDRQLEHEGVFGGVLEVGEEIVAGAYLLGCVADELSPDRPLCAAFTEVAHVGELGADGRQALRQGLVDELASLGALLHVQALEVGLEGVVVHFLGGFLVGDEIIPVPAVRFLLRLGGGGARGFKLVEHGKGLRLDDGGGFRLGGRAAQLLAHVVFLVDDVAAGEGCDTNEGGDGCADEDVVADCERWEEVR